MTWKSSVFFVLLLAHACGGSSTPAPATEGSVSGYVYEGSPVVLVTSLVDVPTGDLPVAGAQVDAVDLGGTVRGSATTGADGAFLIAGLPQGYLRLEVRKAGSVAPDAAADVTAIAGSDVGVNPVFPVDRATAVAAVLAGLPADGVRVLCSMQPLPAGTVVVPAGGDPLTTDPTPVAMRVLASEEYFALIDLHPTAEFAHPVEYAFVDAATGQLTRLSGIQWPPVVNGTGLWSTTEAYTAFPGVDFATVDFDAAPPAAGAVTSPEVVREMTIPTPAPLRAEPHSEPPGDGVLDLHNADPASIFAIVWRAAPENYRRRDVKRIVDLLVNAGVPFDPNIKIVSSPDEGRKDTNGDKQYTFQDSGYWTALQAHNAAIQQRLNQGLHSTLFVYVVSHGGGGAFGHYTDYTTGSFMNITPAMLGLTTTRACRVRGIFDFCYSGGFIATLAGVFNALPAGQRHDYAFYAPCSATEFTYSNPLHYWVLSLGIMEVGSKFLTAALPYMTVAGGDVTGILGPTGTAVRQELTEIFGTLDVISGNAYIHPQAAVQNNTPGWCVPVGVAGVVLDGPLGSFAAGTFIELDRITGGRVADPDACSSVHLHAVSPGGILIDDEGPFPDPAPTTCGYGAIETR